MFKIEISWTKLSQINEQSWQFSICEWKGWKIHFVTLLDLSISSLEGAAGDQGPDEIDRREREDAVIDRDPPRAGPQVVHQFPSLVADNGLEVFLTKTQVAKVLHTEILLSGMEASVAENQAKVFSFDWPGPECRVVPEAMF